MWEHVGGSTPPQAPSRDLLCQQGGHCRPGDPYEQRQGWGCWTQVCSSSDATQQPQQDCPGGIGEWQQEGLPLWVDLSEGGAAG